MSRSWLNVEINKDLTIKEIDPIENGESKPVREWQPQYQNSEGWWAHPDYPHILLLKSEYRNSTSWMVYHRMAGPKGYRRWHRTYSAGEPFNSELLKDIKEIVAGYKDGVFLPTVYSSGRGGYSYLPAPKKPECLKVRSRQLRDLDYA